MTMTVRKQLSVAAWGGAFICSLLLLISANAAVQHYQARSQNAAETYTYPEFIATPTH